MNSLVKQTVQWIWKVTTAVSAGRQPGQRGCFLQALTTLVWQVSLASAVTFSYSYDERDRPAFDPDGLMLRTITEAAMDIWSDYIIDGGNLEFDLSWDDLDDTTLGRYEPGFTAINANIILDTVDQNGNPRNWFFDPTPFQNEEFNMQRSLYGELTPPDPSDWFNGNPPDQLEVGYFSTPSSMLSAGQFDLLSVVLHELGHFAGINFSAFDDDYDFNPDHIGGRMVGVEDDGESHLEPVNSLMTPTINAQIRRLPSATDILAMFDESGYDDLDLPRVDFMGEHGNSWNETLNWVGGRVPNFDNEVFIQHGGIVEIPAGESHVVSDLTVSSSILRVIESNFGVEHDMTIASDAAVEAGGTVVVLGLTQNDGTLLARPGSTLTMSDNDNSALWDFDGAAGSGVIDASQGDFVVSGGDYSDPFDGQLVIGSGRRASFSPGFQIGPGGVVNLNGISAAATLSGGDFIPISGDVEVSGQGVISAPIESMAGAVFDVSGANDGLSLNTSAKRFFGGTFTGDGTLHINTDIDVFGDTTINMKTLNWDGSSVGQNFNIIAGTLTINSETIDNTHAADGFDDTVNIAGQGSLVVNTPQPWRLDGTMRLDTGGILGGSEMIVTSGGLVETIAVFPNPAAAFDAPVRIETGGQIVATAQLDLRNTTTLSGGSLSGARVDQFGDLIVESDSVISPALYNWSATSDQNTIIQPGARLQLSPDSIDFFGFSDRYSGHVTVRQDGELDVDVNNSNGWTAAGTITLEGGLVTGDAFGVVGLLEGVGNVATNMRNLGRVAPGLAIGQLNVNGTYEQRSGGVLEIELAGTTPGSEVDSLSVFGTAILDGSVEIKVEEGFLPDVGAEFEFLDAFLPLQGTFAQLDVRPPVGVMVDGQLQYASNSVSFLVTDSFLIGDFDEDGSWGCADVDSLVSMIATGGIDPAFDLTHDGQLNAADLQAWLVNAGSVNLPTGNPYLPGDANLDGVVDGADFLVWNNNKFTAAPAWCLGDFNADGNVDGADFLAWNGHKFQTSDSTSTVAVPETGSWLMTLLALGLTVRWRRRAVTCARK